MRCPNCLEEHIEFTNHCAVDVLLAISVLVRESLTNEEAQRIMGELNVDMLWEDLGPVIDNLENGVYSNAEE